MLFAAVHESGCGTPRRFAAVRRFERDRSEADMPRASEEATDCRAPVEIRARKEGDVELSATKTIIPADPETYLVRPEKA